jgi:DNA-binding XRE family transcriptional regulator
METRKTISIKQPWCWAILHAGKDIECRVWKTNVRGPILLHAGKRIDKQGVAQLTAEGYDVPTDLPTGGIVGSIVITDCVTDHPSKWAIAGENHWTLANAKALPFHPVAGQLGFFDVEIEPAYRRVGAVRDRGGRVTTRPPHPDDVRDQLRSWQQRKLAADLAVVELQGELAALIPTARRSGLSVVEVAKLAGVSRRTLYRVEAVQIRRSEPLSVTNGCSHVFAENEAESKPRAALGLP